jgi:glycosyltransferase involved in cell wall biosynthesis
MFARASSIVCVSRAEAALVEADFDGAQGKVHVIPNGVERDRFRHAQPRLSDSPYVLSLGRLEPYKRIDRIIEALGKVPLPTRLVIAGEGPARANLEAHARRLRVHDRVDFAGILEENKLAELIAGADVVVSMSEHEAFGLSLIEAFSAGRPVVASDLPAHREAVSYAPADASRIVPLDAPPEAIASELRLSLGTKRHVAWGDGVPTWESVARETRALYDSALQSRNHAAVGAAW